jgi:hypothetical protein
MRRLHSKALSTQTFRRTHLAVMLATVIVNTGAYAAFTIIDDDLLPTAVADARQQALMRQSPAMQQSASDSQQHEIPFFKGSGQLGPLGRQTIDKLLPVLKTAERITIVGRTDAIPVYIQSKAEAEDKTIPLAAVRAEAIRQYLVRQGISAALIVKAPDNTTPNPQANGSIYPSYLTVDKSVSAINGSGNYVSTLTPALSVVNVPYSVYTPNQSATQNYAPATSPLPTTTSALAKVCSELQPAPQTEALAIETIRKVMDLAIAGNYDPQSVKVLLENAYAASRKAAPQANLSITPQTPTSPFPIRNAVPANNNTAIAGIQPIQPMSANVTATTPIPGVPLFVAASATVAKPTWKLEPGKTLRDNLDTWSKTAGWNPSLWQASNYFQVTHDTTLEGDYLDVIRQLAESTQLNMCARRHERYVRVTDASIPCDK